MTPEKEAPNKKVVIYTANYCPYCRSAKKFLQEKNIPFEEIDVTDDSEMRRKLVEMSGGCETVPQIFVDGRSVGGYQELVELYQRGSAL